MRRQGDMVLGPYKDRDGWRVVTFFAGERGNRTFATKGEAEEFKSEAEKEIKHTSPLTVDEVIEEYSIWIKRQGKAKKTIEYLPSILKRVFDGKLETPIQSLNAKHCQKLYEALTESQNRCWSEESEKKLSAASHKTYLMRAKAFLSWAVEKKYISDNPIANVKPVGKVNKGKPQLRIDEARKWLNQAIALANQGDMGAIAAMTAFLLGLRASEVLNRVVRDLDDNGNLLWVTFGKTENAKRTVEIPAMLKPYLLRLAEGKQPEDLLFQVEVNHPVGWLYEATRRICRLAGVPEVCTHSLRGLHSTLAIKAGATSHLVAASLGHGSDDITKQHYIAPGTIQQTQQDRLLNVLHSSATFSQTPSGPESPTVN